MNLLFYTLRTLLRGRGSNVIKVISLGLGLVMSILLFSRVAYEQSFDSDFREVKNVYQIWSRFTVNGETYPLQQSNLGPVAGMLLSEFPDQVESATATNTWMFTNPLYLGNERYDVRIWSADSLFFQTIGIEVLSGQPVIDFQQPGVIYLSQSTARRIFGDADPLGKTISYDHSIDLTVRGVYRDIPSNATVDPKAVVSFPTITAYSRGFNFSWNGGDSWKEYARLRPGTDVEALNASIEKVIPKYLGPKEQRQFDYQPLLKPLRDTYRTQPDARLMTCIMLAMGLAILFIVTLNYVLISISSLSYRAKAVGVHKVNGASNGRILGMFLMETGLLILAALCVMAFIVSAFRDFVEDTACAPLADLFAPSRLWVSGLVILFLFCVGGLLPGRLFTHIPVTQVFRRSTQGRTGWKLALLFVQFAGVAFICGLMCVVVGQYHYLTNKDLGYRTERLAAGAFYPSGGEEGREAARQFFLGLPYVEAVSAGNSTPLDGYSGAMVSQNGRSLFSTRIAFGWNEDYLQLMGIKLLEGTFKVEPGTAVVNQLFAERMHWGQNVLGRRIQLDGDEVTVTGLLQDFQIGTFKDEPQPFATFANRRFAGTLCVRLKEPFAENLQKLNRDVAEAYPDETVDFIGYEDAVTKAYDSVRVFRNSTLVAALVLFFVMLMGLIGYVADEVRRRSKEIAIRKVNGAEVGDILRLLSADILKVAVPSVLLGCVAAWRVNLWWMDSFAFHLSFPAWTYLLIALVTVAVIVACVVVRSWRIACQNPVLSIKNE
jgi:putative ABC transport system permease protein